MCSFIASLCWTVRRRKPLSPAGSAPFLCTWIIDTGGKRRQERAHTVAAGALVSCCLATPHHHSLHRKEHDEPNVFFIFSRIIALGGSTSTSASSHTHLAAAAAACDINFSTPARDAATGEERGREIRGWGRDAEGSQRKTCVSHYPRKAAAKGWELTLHINIHLYANQAINSPYGKKKIEKLKIIRDGE